MGNLESQSANLKLTALLLALVLAACTPGKATPTATATAGPAQATIVTLTFDDGDADNFAAAELLRQQGLHATFFIPSGLVGTPGYMTWDELKQLQQDGNEIGGHSLDHTKVQGLDATALRHEICDDRTNLMEHGFTPVSFAYPFGNYDPAAKAMLKDCGYSGARTVRGGPQPLPLDDPYAVKALPYIVNDTTLAKMQRYVNGTRQTTGGWVILTFHHVCAGCDYFAVDPAVWAKFVPWLARQQQAGAVRVETFGEVVR